MITCVFDHLSGSINIVFRTSIVFSWSIHHRLIFVPVRIGNGFTNFTNDSTKRHFWNWLLLGRPSALPVPVRLVPTNEWTRWKSESFVQCYRYYRYCRRIHYPLWGDLSFGKYRQQRYTCEVKVKLFGSMFNPIFGIEAESLMFFLHRICLFFAICQLPEQATNSNISKRGKILGRYQVLRTRENGIEKVRTSVS